MQIRKPIVAGQFYPAQHNDCLDEINQLLEQRSLPDSLPQNIISAIVPHAGWVFSGSLAAMAFAAIKQQCQRVNTFVIFGAAHSYSNLSPAVYDQGSWITPMGEIAIDSDLAADILESNNAVSDPQAHRSEHSIEVQVPFIQHIFPGAKIVPIIVPPSQESIHLGTSVAKVIANDSKTIICIGSTDLTHYGPHYGFEPMGPGPGALQWAKDVNDKQFIDLAVSVSPENMLKNSLENFNACGPGAAAATVAVAKNLEKTKGQLLSHTSSSEITLQRMNQKSEDSVGYATIVF